MGGNVAKHSDWTFLTSHARVLLTISRDPGKRLRDIASICGVTERTVQSIVTDLEEAGYLRRSRGNDGRRNSYTIVQGSPFRHPAEAGYQVTDLLALLTEPGHAPGAATD
ncbi:helix-turn-helix transcriptional regulator [Streptomyces sp. NPDC056480]|uniref:helix-turn-helix transcriptional regulator n=1 Tax=Streptomyces sp. NPDC056480 TaxID=3345833 RepID=UPI00369E75DF